MKGNRGFTLIEMVVVIVILGILAVTAAPKFLNLQGDARNATLEGVKGAMRTTADLVNVKLMIAGFDGEGGVNAHKAGFPSDLRTMCENAGVSCYFQYGYPSSWETLALMMNGVGDDEKIVYAGSKAVANSRTELRFSFSTNVNGNDKSAELKADECYVAYRYPMELDQKLEIEVVPCN